MAERWGRVPVDVPLLQPITAPGAPRGPECGSAPLLLSFLNGLTHNHTGCKSPRRCLGRVQSSPPPRLRAGLEIDAGVGKGRREALYFWQAWVGDWASPPSCLHQALSPSPSIQKPLLPCEGKGSKQQYTEAFSLVGPGCQNRHAGLLEGRR